MSWSVQLLAFMPKPTACASRADSFVLELLAVASNLGGPIYFEESSIIGTGPLVMFLVYGQKTSGSMSHLANVGLFTRLKTFPSRMSATSGIYGR